MYPDYLPISTKHGVERNSSSMVSHVRKLSVPDQI